MPPKCTVCIHPARDAIDAELVAGGALRNVAQRFDLGYSALSRHKNAHIPTALTKAQEAREIAAADSLL